MKGRKFRLAGMVAVTALLSACGSTIHTRSALGTAQTLSIDAKQRLVIQGHREDGVVVTCAEPSPDALVAEAAVLSAGGKAPTKAGEVSGNAGVGYQEAAASLGHRTQTVQILRDGYYRLCEAYLNGAIDKRQYHDVLSQVDLAIAVVAAVDGLGNARSAPAVAIGTGNVDISGEAAISAAPAGAFHDGAGGTTDTSKSAEAVEKIIARYIGWVAKRTELLWRLNRA